jgi:hypothetical protein
MVHNKINKEHKIMEISIDKLKELIREIENDYDVKPTNDNQGYCLNAKEGYEVLMVKVLECYSGLKKNN